MEAKTSHLPVPFLLHFSSLAGTRDHKEGREGTFRLQILISSLCCSLNEEGGTQNLPFASARGAQDQMTAEFPHAG